MSETSKRRLLSVLGLAVSIIPPLVATIMYFPLWTERGSESVVSGGVLALGIMCLVPLYKKLGQAFRSPSAPVMWALLALFMYLMKSIAGEVYVIAVVGTVSNTVGALIFRLRRRYRRE